MAYFLNLFLPIICLHVIGIFTFLLNVWWTYIHSLIKLSFLEFYTQYTLFNTNKFVYKMSRFVLQCKHWDIFTFDIIQLVSLNGIAAKSIQYTFLFLLLSSNIPTTFHLMHHPYIYDVTDLLFLLITNCQIHLRSSLRLLIG